MNWEYSSAKWVEWFDYWLTKRNQAITKEY